MAQVREALGPTRTEVLAKPLRDRSRDLVPPLPEDLDVRVVYHAQRRPDGRVVHGLRVEDVNGSQRYEMPVEFPGPEEALTDGETYLEAGIRHPLSPNSPLWHFRHLFGAEPLIPLEPAGDAPDPGSGP